MTKYVVVAAALGVPTGKENPLTRLPDVVRFVRGQVVDSEKFSSEASTEKLQRLLNQGALRDPEDIPQQAREEYQSDFDIPLDKDPAETRAEAGIVKLPGDDIEDEGEDDHNPDDTASPDALLHPAPTEQRAPSLVDGTPEARLQGEAVTSDGTDEALADRDGDGEVDPPSRGASTAVWQQFAQQIKLDVPADASRGEIQEAYDKRQSEKG